MGLIPSWARDPKISSRLINARIESITEKPSLKVAAARRRCLVPATGYCEWDKRDGAKIPHLLHGDGVLAMAGLYELWPDCDLQRLPITSTHADEIPACPCCDSPGR